MDTNNITFISSIVGIMLNLGVTGTLFRSQLKQSMRDTGTDFVFSYQCYLLLFFIFSGQTSCGLNGFVIQISNLSSQLALFAIAWKYTMKTQISRWYYVAFVWIPTLSSLILVPTNN